MSNTSNIQWTDATWSPVTGCTRVSPGCKLCYAEKLTATRLKHNPKYAGLAVINSAGEARWTGKVRLHEDELTVPLHWRKPRRIFVCSMSDLFHEDVPDAFIDEVFEIVARCPRHTFQVLTKRPARMSEYLRAAHAMIPRRSMGHSMIWPNLWLGTSVEDQERADERIPHLVRCPAVVRFLSCEPLLGPVELTRVTLDEATDSRFNALTGRHDWNGRYVGSVDWVIVGGESGPHARPFNVDWARSIIAQCKAAGVSCFMKQIGSHPTTTDNVADWRRGWPEGSCVDLKGNRVLLRDKKGGSMDEWPIDLRVRELPTQTPAVAVEVG